MIRKVSLGIFGVMFCGLMFSSSVFARDIFSDNSSYPIGSPNFDYSNPCPIGRPCVNADSIDQCLNRKEWHYNEQYGIWVNGIKRCKINSEGILSVATENGVSTAPADVQLCVGKREGQIIEQGSPSGDEALSWSNRCSYLGALGGAGVPSSSSGTSAFLQYFGLGSSGSGTGSGAGSGASNVPLTADEQRIKDFLTDTSNNLQDRKNLYQNSDVNRLFPDASQRASVASQLGLSSSDFTPLYDGPGVQVPSPEIAAKGIIKEQSLINLIVFYTNATLPYVSVLGVLAFVGAGMFYILSFTNEELNGKAKNMMTYVVIGIIIIISAYTIVNTLLSFALG